jgi:Ni/Fe-hydrogenase subunit HybB-like protein
MSRITAWIIIPWLVLRFADLILRGTIPLAFEASQPAALFWLETLLLVAAITMLFLADRNRSARIAFLASILAGVGGMLYRFDPTTTVYQPGAGACYFPSLIELFIAIGFVSLAVAGFSVLAKVLAILPAPTELWYAMEYSQTIAEINTTDDVEVTQYAAAD